jgi:hypothetical protein
MLTPTLDFGLIQQAERLITGENTHDFRPFITQYQTFFKLINLSDGSVTDKEKEIFTELLPIYESSIRRINAASGNPKVIKQVRDEFKIEWNRRFNS